MFIKNTCLVIENILKLLLNSFLHTFFDTSIFNQCKYHILILSLTTLVWTWNVLYLLCFYFEFLIQSLFTIELLVLYVMTLVTCFLIIFLTFIFSKFRSCINFGKNRYSSGLKFWRLQFIKIKWKTK